MDLRAGKKLIKTNLHIGRYILNATKNRVVNRKQPITQRQRALEVTAENSRNVLRDMNINVTARYEQEDIFDRNYFMVCNHMSYMDILVLSSIQPAVFVTSVEMEKTFFLGDMAKLGGSFFVDRVNRRKMKEEVAALEKLLGDGFNVFIFPEGTSTDGSKILPFKKSLFRVPFQAGSAILPICLKYKTIDGEPFSPENCDRVCWYDDMTFAPHFLQMMKMNELQVDLHYLNPLESKDFESHGALCKAAEESIRQSFEKD